MFLTSLHYDECLMDVPMLNIFGFNTKAVVLSNFLSLEHIVKRVANMLAH